MSKSARGDWVCLNLEHCRETSARVALHLSRSLEAHHAEEARIILRSLRDDVTMRLKALDRVLAAKKKPVPPAPPDPLPRAA